MLHVYMPKWVLTITEKKACQKRDLQQLQMLIFRGLVEDKDSVSTKRQVKLSKNLFLQFIREIDMTSWSVTVSHTTRTDE